MKDIWDKPITADTDWGGDASTGGLPVSGRIVQEYIKSRLKTDEQLKAFIKAYLDENGMSEDQGYVTLATEQTIKAIKDFEAGLKIGGSLITYDKDLNAFILRANLVTEGGITARALLDEVDVPTFMDGVVTDEVTISKADGVLRVLKAGLDKEELINILEEEKYVTQSWVKSYNAEELKKYVLQTDLPSDIVTLSIDQEITGIKNFANGFEIAGIKFSKSQDGTIFLEGNLVTSGGITARGTNTTQSPSIFEALPIDGDTIKRTADGRLYVDADALNISGGGGVADSVSWENVTGKPTWIGSTKPTYTPKEIGALGVLDTALNSLSLGGYNHDNYLRWERMGGVSVDLNQVFDFSIKSVQNNAMNYPSASPYGVLLSLPYRNASGNAIPDFGVQLYFANGDDALPNAYWRDSYKNGYKNWRAILDSSNYSDYALPITGGTVYGTIKTTGGIFLGAALEAYPVGDIYRFRVTADANYTYVQAGAPDGTKSGQLYFTGYNASVLSTLYIKATSVGTYGNVAIGGTTATEKLHVYGNILATGGITARYTSDMRLKQNRRSFKASEVLMSLGAVQQFEYIPSEVEKNKIYEGIHIGLIYQNVVGTALHRMCHERDDGYGSLNYLEPSFISLLAGVGQEHEVRIQQLERENKTLKEEVEKLRKRVA